MEPHYIKMFTPFTYMMGHRKEESLQITTELIKHPYDAVSISV